MLLNAVIKHAKPATITCSHRGALTRSGTSRLWRGTHCAPARRSSGPIWTGVRAGKLVPDALFLPCLSRHSPDIVWTFRRPRPRCLRRRLFPAAAYRPIETLGTGSQIWGLEEISGDKCVINFSKLLITLVLVASSPALTTSQLFSRNQRSADRTRSGAPTIGSVSGSSLPSRQTA